MGYVPPSLPVAMFNAGVLTRNEVRAMQAGFTVLQRGPQIEPMVIMPQPINCCGCGANHAAVQCPYCGRGRS
jgi:hypothetical protein